MKKTPIFIHTNKELAFKLEIAEAANQVEFVLSHNRYLADSQARYKKIGSGFAIFAGVDSPLTQIFGLGLAGEVSVEQIIELEEFFKQQNSSVNVEVCHLSDLKLSRFLIERGYQISEYSNVLLRRINEDDRFEISANNGIQKITDDEVEVIAATISQGFLETIDIPPSFIELFQVSFSQPNCAIFAAYKDGDPAGGGAVFIKDEIAIFGGASTLPRFRNQGIQTDLLKARLAYAQAKGCKWAMVTTAPGSVSQKNVERRGFQVVYARTKFTKEW
jgi:GNAT superfamily N-acetyltransferase